MITHLSAADFVTMPWANGKGTTVELLRVERVGRLILRLSRAMVVEDGPFSILPNIARILTVLSGPGFDLVGEGLHLPARPLHPVAFAGDIALRAMGVAQPCEDFNVMTAADLPPAKVAVYPAGTSAQGAYNEITSVPGAFTISPLGSFAAMLSESLPPSTATPVAIAGARPWIECMP